MHPGGLADTTHGQPAFALRMNWDHEPTPNPSHEGNIRRAEECWLPSWERNLRRMDDCLLPSWEGLEKAWLISKAEHACRVQCLHRPAMRRAEDSPLYPA